MNIYNTNDTGHDTWAGSAAQATAGSTGASTFTLSPGAPNVAVTLALSPQTTLGFGPGRTTENIYDDAGRLVASRFNDDPWTCVTHDTRGRVTQTVVPDINGRIGRTVTTNYSYQGSPFKVQVVDSVAGTAVSEIDLLGRAVSATDTFGNVSTVAYDDQGRVASKVTPFGTESYTYDTYDRATEYKVDDVTYASMTYDTYSRVQDITYDQAKDASDNKLKLEQIKRDLLQRNNGAVFRFSNGTAFDETVTRTQTGKATAYTDTYNGSTAGGAYTYDKAGRLTAATIDGNTYSYGYGTPTGCTGTYNANANKNSNRTTFTANGVTTTYCYDYADRLVSSTDTQLGTPTYDDHGNTISLAGGGTPISFTYDATDTNTAIQQGDYKVEYLKSAGGGVLRKKEYAAEVLTASYRYLAGGAVLQSCNLTDDNDCVTTDKYLGLPGGVSLTLSPTNPDPTKQTIYTVKNFHGDAAITANEQGAPTSSVFLYEPFGQAAASSTFGTNSNPTNATDNSMGWAADPARKVAGAFSLPLIQMGARLYLPTAGRFLQVDPIEGGTANSYVYVGDPINGSDYTGKSGICLQGCSSQTTYMQGPGALAGSNKIATTPPTPTPPIWVGNTPITSGTRGRTAVVMPPAGWKKPSKTTVKSPDAAGYIYGAVEAERASRPPMLVEGPSGREYLNIGVNIGIPVFGIPLAVGGGIKIGSGGFHPYVSGGASGGIGRIGGSVTYSPSKLSTGASTDYSAFYWVGGSYSDDGSWEFGLGTPGISAMRTYTW